MNPSKTRRTRLYAPRYWPTWLGAALLWCLTRLPYRLQLVAGRALGYLMHCFGGRRKRIMRTNIDLCFPALTDRERTRILRENFVSMGIAVLEMGMSWWVSERRLRRLATIEGMENLDAALQAGHGAILLSAHFTTMEIGGRLLSMFAPFQVLYREHKNAAMEYIIHRGRDRFTHKAILRDNLLGMRRSLRQNIPVWYAPDQDFGIGKGVFVPFFGIPAATITATSTLAKMAQSPVVPFYQTRLPGARGYRLTLLPALEHFPGGDPEADTRRINALLEDLIRQQPEQYLWAHRRFKTRPPGTPPLYDSGR
jgi:KDO2-lipid IV(A) lauroyltransferase